MIHAPEYPKTLFKHGEARNLENSAEEARARAEGFTEPYKHKEYPKSLHKNGNREKEEVVVHDGIEEAEARKRGFKTIHEVETAALSKKDAQSVS